MKSFLITGEQLGKIQDGKVYQGVAVRNFTSRIHEFTVVPNIRGLFMINGSLRIQYNLIDNNNNNTTIQFHWVRQGNLINLNGQDFISPNVLLFTANWFPLSFEIKNYNFEIKQLILEKNITFPFVPSKTEVSFEINNCVFLELKFLANRYAEI